MGTGIPIFPLGSGNYRCDGEWHTDPALDRKIKPYNLSTTTPLVINRDTDLVDLTKKVIPAYATKNTSNNKKESNQTVDEWLISQSWGLTNRWTVKLFLIE